MGSLALFTSPVHTPLASKTRAVCLATQEKNRMNSTRHVRIIRSRTTSCEVCSANVMLYGSHACRDNEKTIADTLHAAADSIRFLRHTDSPNLP